MSVPLLVAVARRCSCGPGAPPGRSVPTPTGVREIPGLHPSSSSSPVWKLGTEPLRAGQRPSRHVGPLWGTRVLLLSTRGYLDGRAQSPSVVHVLSPLRPLPVPSPCPGPSGVRRPAPAGGGDDGPPQRRKRRSARQRRAACTHGEPPGDGTRCDRSPETPGHSPITISPGCAHPWGQLGGMSTTRSQVTAGQPRDDGPRPGYDRPPSTSTAVDSGRGVHTPAVLPVGATGGPGS